jgi:hypothetical protein
MRASRRSRLVGTKPVLIAAVLAVAGAASGSASAALITVTGGFTAFHSDLVFGNASGSGISSTLNGDPLCPNGGCNVNGPADVKFASPVDRVAFQNGDFLGTLNAENAVSFTPGPEVDVAAAGDRFLLGTLTYENGVWSSSLLGTTFDVVLTTHSSNPPFDGQIFSDTLQLAITPNSTTNTPGQNADSVYFLNNVIIGSLSAFELNNYPLSPPADPSTQTNIVSAELWGFMGSLHLDSFRNVTGGGFLQTPTQVPEPESWSLFAAGLAALAFLQRRRRAAAA